MDCRGLVLYRFSTCSFPLFGFASVEVISTKFTFITEVAEDYRFDRVHRPSQAESKPLIFVHRCFLSYLKQSHCSDN